MVATIIIILHVLHFFINKFVLMVLNYIHMHGCNFELLEYSVINIMQQFKMPQPDPTPMKSEAT